MFVRITGRLTNYLPHRKSGPAKVGQANKSLIVFLGGYIFKHILSRHEILMLSRSPIKCEQRPDLTIAVDWDVKQHIDQTSNNVNWIHENHEY